MEINNPEKYNGLNDINSAAFYSMKRKEYKKFFSVNKYSSLFINKKMIN